MGDSPFAKFSQLDQTGRGCVYIDADWSHFPTAASMLWAPDTDKEREVLQLQLQQKMSVWALQHSYNGNTPLHFLTTLSARSGLDLYLQAKSFAPGSIVFMSAINIPDISRVLQHHKLIPVPVDVDVRTLQVDAKSLDACLSVARQRNLRVAFVMVAHLWGRVSDVSSTVSICRAHRDTPLVEDLAECFQGGKYIGSPYSEFCFFSFGAIKTNTAFGGSIVRLKNRDTHERMAQLQREYRPQPKKVFWRKIYSCFAAALLLNSSKANRAVSLTGRCVGWDPKPHVVSLLRGFSGDIIYRLRHAPSRALLAFLSWRLDNFSPANAAANADRAELMLQMMPTAMRERVPGIDVPVKDRSHWLFPIVPQDTERTLRLLVAFGIEAYQGATQLALVPRAGDYEGWLPDSKLEVLESGFPATPYAEQLMTEVIYLPVHRLTTRSTVRHIGRLLHAIHDSETRQLTHTLTHTQEQLPSVILPSSL